MTGLVFAAVVALAAAAMTGMIRRYALARLLDLPNERSSHRIATPRGGGLAIVLAFFIGCVAMTLSGRLSPTGLGLLASGLVVAGAGFWDDHGHVPARIRLAAHVVAGGWALGVLDGFPELPVGAWVVPLAWCGSALALLWLVWLLNLYNFMDGIDAIAGMETVFVAVASLILMGMRPEGIGDGAYALAALAAAVMGFLVWNWPPAKIFMGDVGSGFVGYSLALIALVDMRGAGGGLGFPVWVILNGVFLVDATYTLLRRIATGQQWYSPHRSHAYQKAAQLRGEHRPVVIYITLINVFWLFPCALVAVLAPGLAMPILFLALAPLLAVAIRLKAGEP